MALARAPRDPPKPNKCRPPAPENVFQYRLELCNVAMDVRKPCDSQTYSPGPGFDRMQSDSALGFVAGVRTGAELGSLADAELRR